MYNWRLALISFLKELIGTNLNESDIQNITEQYKQVAVLENIDRLNMGVLRPIIDKLTIRILVAIHNDDVYLRLEYSYTHPLNGGNNGYDVTYSNNNDDQEFRQVR